MQRLIIIGGGFAGFWSAISAAREAMTLGKREELSITLISKDEFHTIKPRLYEKNLDGMQISLKQYCEPLGIKLVVDKVLAINPKANTIHLANDAAVNYDALVFAAGSQLNKPDLSDKNGVFNIDSFAAAQTLSAHLALLSQENFSTESSHNIVIVGAGLTGFELATSMMDRFNNKTNQATKIKIHLVDRNAQLAPMYSELGQQYIAESLAVSNVELHLGDEVQSYNKPALVLTSGETINTETVIWTVGVRANKLAKFLTENLDEVGRIHVDKYLRLKNYANVFVAGDAAKVAVDENNFALMSCQHAMPQGKLAGHNAVNTLFACEMKSYAQPRYVTCLDLGKNNALFTSGWEYSVEMTGRDAKEFKNNIVTKLIYPSLDIDKTLGMSLLE